MAAPDIIGQTLGHYCILEIIGAGGMGEVYRAHDEQLERDVALKILPAGLLSNENARRQFRREALALGKLNHPHIETVFEFSTQDGVDFLAMELIHGAPISEKLTGGPLPEAEVLRLGKQIAEGLSAASQQGIVHRDLKPSNLMLTTEGRLKILDFGLAKLTHPNTATDPTRSLSGHVQTISGTIPYMSPEQLRGLPVDSRTDIYATGAVLYEMCTGKRAFQQQQSAELIGSILHDNPRPPRTLNPRIGSGLQNIILKCLEKSPARRYQSATELLKALEAVGKVPESRTGFWIAAAVILILGIGVAIGLNFGGLRERILRHRGSAENEAVPTSSVKARRSVAVLGFKNSSGRADVSWLGTGIAEMLTTELGTGNQIRTVAAENVARARRDLSISDADTLAGDTLAHLRKNLGADYIVLGSYVALGEGNDAEVRLDLRIQNAQNGETVGLISQTGKQIELFDLVTSAGTVLRDKLGISPMSPTETREVRSLIPANQDASRLYAEGLSELRNFNPTSARDLLEKAVTEDPNFALAHSALADAWSALGYDAKAASEASKALNGSANLDREERLAIEGHYYLIDKQWPKAIETYRGLWAFAPDNPEYGLRLAQCQSSGGQPKEALNTVAALRKLPSPINDDPRIDLAEEAAARASSDSKRALAASLAAAEKGKARQSALLVAYAQLAQSRSYYGLGDLDRARQAAEEARRLFASAGDRSSEAAALHNIATVLSDKGDNAGAKAMNEQVLATCRNVGNQKCVADALNGIGIILKDQADFDGAQKQYRQSIAIRREIGDRSGEAVSLNNVAVVFYQQGQLANARKTYEQALAIARSIGEKRGIARALTNLGIVLQDQGHLAQAQSVCEESIAIRRQIADRQGLGIALNNYGVLLLEVGDLPAAEKAIEEQLAISQQIGNQRGLAYALFVKGNILLAQGKLADTRTTYEQALAIRNKLGERTTAEENRVSLAKLSIEEGHPDVEASLREVLAQARKQKEPEIETFAEITLAESLLKLGRPADAAKEIASTEAAAMNTEARLHRIDAFITAARVHAALHEWSKAQQLLTTAISEANQMSCGRCQLEARLALAELSVRRKDKNAHGLSATLNKDATKRGFMLVAQKSAALSTSN
jgi:tetratricopeptide (TPR) repeat protein